MIPEAGEETLQAVLNGDAEAFRSILRSYGPRVERLVSAHVLPHEVPEVAQETFVRAYRSLRSYQGQGSFERWLATIALRCCYERLRERYRPEAPFSSLARGEEDEPEGLTDQASFRLYEEENERRDLREELESALQSLEPRDRMLLTLTFLEGYSIAETAAMMDMTPINVRSGSTTAAKLRGRSIPLWNASGGNHEQPLQSLRGVLSALSVSSPPRTGCWKRRGAAGTRAYEPAFLLDEAWEERVMFAVRLSPMDDPDVPDWLAQRFRPLALANAVIILCALMLFWHAGDPGTALAEYAQSALAGYEVFF
ncbi:MAG: RNA polymerase sigma factor [Bilophila wadsworthia]